jgi:hypothetical protein
MYMSWPQAAEYIMIKTKKKKKDTAIASKPMSSIPPVTKYSTKTDTGTPLQAVRHVA